MSSVPGDQRSEGSALAVASFGDADRALLLAMAAWGAPSHPENGPVGLTSDFRARLCRRLAPAGFPGVRAAELHESSLAGFREPQKAKERLASMHSASARVEPAQVHPSWWIRALREESPAVQRMVARAVPASVREPLQSGLLLDRDDLRSERAASAEFVNWVLALWTERLVGGDAERPDDPPAIIAICRLSPRSGYRLCHFAGLCKLIVAGHEKPDQGRLSIRARHEWLIGRLVVNAEIQAMVRLDVEDGRYSRLRPRRRQARIGLVTFARLLAEAEPFRLRWALQHWPYPIAKLVRSLMPSAGGRSPAQLQWESLVLKTAWDRLNVEGRISLSAPNEPTEDWRSLT